MSEPTPTRPSLLVALRDSQDDQAWSEFVALYTPLIFGHCLRRGLQEADAADVAQEVMKAVAGAIPRFEYDRGRGSFRAWLLTVIRSKLNNFFSRRARQPETVGDTSVNELAEDQSLPADDAAWETECRQRLFDWATERVRSEFQANTWQAFWKTAVEQRPVADVAAELELTAGAVYIARSRVIARLRAEIETATGEDELPAKFG